MIHSTIQVTSCSSFAKELNMKYYDENVHRFVFLVLRTKGDFQFYSFSLETNKHDKSIMNL